MHLAERDHPRRKQTLGRGRGLLRDAVGTSLRASGRHSAADVHEVLDRNGEPVQRSLGATRGALAIGSFRGGERFVAVDLDKTVELAVEQCDALEEGGDDLA